MEGISSSTAEIASLISKVCEPFNVDIAERNQKTLVVTSSIGTLIPLSDIVRSLVNTGWSPKLVTRTIPPSCTIYIVKQDTDSNVEITSTKKIPVRFFESTSPIWKEIISSIPIATEVSVEVSTDLSTSIISMDSDYAEMTDFGWIITGTSKNWIKSVFLSCSELQRPGVPVNPYFQISLGQNVLSRATAQYDPSAKRVQ